jgi:hypothetical protein
LQYPWYAALVMSACRNTGRQFMAFREEIRNAFSGSVSSAPGILNWKAKERREGGRKESEGGKRGREKGRKGRDRGVERVSKSTLQVLGSRDRYVRC